MAVTKCAPQEAIRALGVAYKNWLHSLSGKRKGLKAKGSANRKKSAQRLARLHWHIANIRNNALHQLTHRLTRDYGWVAIEDLNVKGMMANRRLARGLADASFGEFRRQLTYKGLQRGCRSRWLTGGIRRARRVQRVVIGCWRYRSRSGTGRVRCGRWSLWSLRALTGRKLP